MEYDSITEVIEWDKNSKEWVKAEDVSSIVNSTEPVSAQVNLAGYTDPSINNLVEEISDLVGRPIDNLSVRIPKVEHYYDYSGIEISTLKLTSFDLQSNDMLSEFRPRILMSETSDDLRYFSIQGMSISQELLDTVSACPNLEGIIITEGGSGGTYSHNPASQIPSPANTNIKYWMFSLNDLRSVDNWESDSLEMLMLDNMRLREMPEVLLHPPDSLRYVYLPRNLLHNENIKYLSRFLSSGGGKILSLSGNTPILDVPIWDGVDVEQCVYYADRAKFSPSMSDYYDEDIIIASQNDKVPCELSLPNLPIVRLVGSSEFVLHEIADRNAKKALGDEQEFHHIHLRGINLASNGYEHLFGVNDFDPPDPEKVKYIRRYIPLHI